MPNLFQIRSHAPALIEVCLSASSEPMKELIASNYKVIVSHETFSTDKMILLPELAGEPEPFACAWILAKIPAGAREYNLKLSGQTILSVANKLRGAGNIVETVQGRLSSNSGKVIGKKSEDIAKTFSNAYEAGLVGCVLPEHEFSTWMNKSKACGFAIITNTGPTQVIGLGSISSTILLKTLGQLEGIRMKEEKLKIISKYIQRRVTINNSEIEKIEYL